MTKYIAGFSHLYVQVGFQITRKAMAENLTDAIFSDTDFSDEWLALYGRALRAARMNRTFGGDS